MQLLQVDKLRMSAEIGLRKQLDKTRYRTFYKTDGWDS